MNNDLGFGKTEAKMAVTPYERVLEFGFKRSWKAKDQEEVVLLEKPGEQERRAFMGASRRFLPLRGMDRGRVSGAVGSEPAQELIWRRIQLADDPDVLRRPETLRDPQPLIGSQTVVVHDVPLDLQICVESLF